MTRLIAAVLRDEGFRVLAKTTGSRPVMINPDGTEAEIIRHGRPSILEAKKILKVAKHQNAQAVVMELMGILPESIYVESVRMLKPHMLVITNVRHDHGAQMGTTKEAIASCFASAIPEDGVVFVLDNEFFPVYRAVSEQRKSRLIEVQRESQPPLTGDDRANKSLFAFADDIHLTMAVSEHLGLNREKAHRAMARALPDFGSLKVWVKEKDFPDKKWFFVSAFGANDPQSTREIFSIDTVRTLLEGRRVIGLLNFREDRGDRTIQWIEALEKDEFPELDRLVLLGHHAVAARRKLKTVPKDKIQVLTKHSPAEIIQRLSQQERNDTVLIGMGNMKGAGKAFVDLWEETGRRYGI